MKKRILAILSAIVLSMCFSAGCGKNDTTAEFDAYKAECKSYVAAFENSSNPKIKNAAAKYTAEIDALSSDNKSDITEKVAAFSASAADILMPLYKENLTQSMYTTSDGKYIKGDSSLAGLGGYPEGKGDYYLAAGTTAVYTKETFEKIASITEEALKEKLLKVTTANELFAETIISFTGKGEVVMSNYYTPLGVEFVRAVFGKEVAFEKLDMRSGTYEQLASPKENTNDYYFIADFNGDKIPFVFNARDGSVSRLDIFGREVLPIYGIAMVQSNTGAGYTSKKFADGTEKYLDVKYGNRKVAKLSDTSTETDEARMRQKMDVFVPANLDKSRENGVILALHGGSWVSGKKEEMHVFCAEYTNAGYITATMNYNYAGKKYEDGEACTLLTMNDEIRQAFAKLKQMSDEYGWNITKAAVTGYSAGCHLALNYAYSIGRSEQAPIPVVLATGLVGPLDFRNEYWEDTSFTGLALAAAGLADSKICDKDGNTEYDAETLAEKLGEISPLWRAQKGDAVPTVVGYGAMDKAIVSYSAAPVLDKALADHNIEHELVTFGNSNHAMANNPYAATIYKKRVAEYLKKYFGY